MNPRFFKTFCLSSFSSIAHSVTDRYNEGAHYEDNGSPDGIRPDFDVPVSLLSGDDFNDRTDGKSVRTIPGVYDCTYNYAVHLFCCGLSIDPFSLWSVETLHSKSFSVDFVVSNERLNPILTMSGKKELNEKQIFVRNLPFDVTSEVRQSCPTCYRQCDAHLFNVFVLYRT